MNVHTPGPWKVCKGNDCIIENESGYKIGTAFIGRPEYEANAKIIAESPVMYRLLEEEVFYLNHWINTAGIPANVKNVMQERVDFINLSLNAISK